MKELSERTLPASEQKRFYSLEREAAECRIAGRYGGAEDLYSQALLLSTQVFGPDTIETAKVINAGSCISSWATSRPLRGSIAAP
jgi:hypothetical protein